jgi:hypothetical protein
MTSCGEAESGGKQIPFGNDRKRSKGRDRKRSKGKNF